MRSALLFVTLASAVWAAPPLYELRGRFQPAMAASVCVHSASSPFEDSTLAGDDGRFRFRGLQPGAYSVTAFVPGRGETRRTIEIGPSHADAKGRVELVMELSDDRFEFHDSVRREALVSVRELAIPPQAFREYDEGRKRLAKPDVAGAIAHFQRTVEIAPQFMAAWNYLGTIAYQQRDYQTAERYFRKALAAGPDAFEPLVNLGGVLLNLGRFEEALQHNRHAVLTHPRDALANSQLGMTYFYLRQLDLSQKYLTVAERIDPAQFSRPQLLLAEIYARSHDNDSAAAELEAFLKHHPDATEAGRIRARIAQLRAAR